MKLPVSWINTFATCDGSKPFADKVTMNGLEVEEIYTIPKEDFANYGGEATNNELCWDVKVTPNRGDWLSVLGVAREVAIVNQQPYKMPKINETVTTSITVILFFKEITLLISYEVII